MLRHDFVGSFPRADVPLDPSLPELALIGRSNVGKSSLLNALVGQRIARVSQTPGKTRALNVFRIDIRSGEWGGVTPHVFDLLALPRYGSAEASQNDRAALRHLPTRRS